MNYPLRTARVECNIRQLSGRLKSISRTIAFVGVREILLVSNLRGFLLLSLFVIISSINKRLETFYCTFRSVFERVLSKLNILLYMDYVILY